MIVGLLIAFCAVLLAKWLAVVAIAAVVLLAVLRFALRRVVAAVRARREARQAVVPGAVAASLATPAPAPAPVPARPRATGPTCTWCGLTGGHQDLRGRHVRPRHAHAGALTRM
ncbi:hypothetical protein EV188_111112 [Actinomycetospora succinea]|uniref:Uncharacterized protein n=2 Tax=Actinomycetospora succinea TaxID=663603 RepID=A0A4R6UPV5_9PSEU|nr:hypothetical protein EV188_111112 [Actinomycetospora succinea]